MKKVYLLALVLIIAGSNSAEAQFIKFGVKGGVNFPSINALGNNISYDAKSGWHAGAGVQLNIPIVKVGAELLYSANKGIQEITKEELKTAHFTIPIYGKISILKIIQIHTGPQFSFIMNAEEGNANIKEQWDNQTFSWMAGAGVALGPLDFHARFIFPQTTTLGTVTEEFKDSNIQLSAMFWFGGGKK